MSLPTADIVHYFLKHCCHESENLVCTGLHITDRNCFIGTEIPRLRNCSIGMDSNVFKEKHLHSNTFRHRLVSIHLCIRVPQSSLEIVDAFYRQRYE
ncbi:hypothetical protein CEXT_201611 [Caerostris extrusa]|uniref:Uncharacterized protein n=1 Tax=Caerostris extrusa TaxID=172846 RepID=A0AAV4MSF5_CAEEX|nr:hypothetical protein CEXT_201611 [Caerostris extrusa]